jgi:membrane protein implicated in regulation of membrane protease activity
MGHSPANYWDQHPTLPTISKINEKANESELFIYNKIKERYDLEIKRISILDTKASNLVGWIGLIISILAAGLEVFTKNGVFISLGAMALLVVVFIVLITSLFFSLIAARLRRYWVFPGPNKENEFVNDFQDLSHKIVVTRVTSETIIGIKVNVSESNRKVLYITIAWILFLIGMGFASLSIFWILQTL